MLWIPMGEWRRSFNWDIVMDIGGRVSCSTREDMGCIGEIGWMEGSVMGRVLVIEDREEIEVVDIVEVIEEIEDMRMKSG